MSSGKHTHMRHKPLSRYRTLSPGISANHMEAKNLGSAMPRKPILPVRERKIKDSAVSWYNLMLKWKTLNDAGFATANNIANRKISLLSEDKMESGSPACNENAEQRLPEYPKELTRSCRPPERV